MSKKVWYLQQLHLFKGLDIVDLKKIELLFSMKQFCKGETVYQPGEKNYVFVVKTGKVEVSQLNEDGKKYIIDVLQPGSLFGDLGLEGDESVFVESLDDSYVCWMDKDSFFMIVSQYPSVAKKMMQYLYDRLLVAERKTASLATDNIGTRFLKLIVSLAKPLPGGKPAQLITDSFTHEQLAQMLGISRQTMTSLINTLAKKGVIERKGKRLVIDKAQMLSHT